MMVQLQLDLSAAEMFFACLKGRKSLEELMLHPAYNTISKHARHFSSEITIHDIEAALAGKPSPFYGLNDLSQNLPRIENLLETFRCKSKEWLDIVQNALASLFPSEDLSITVYPVIGYDMGIGMGGNVCMNCNVPQYLERPEEFLFFIIHECVHVIFARSHPVASLSEIITPSQWRAYFNLWVQNEGYAVYAPLRLRQECGCMGDRDYRVLSDPLQTSAHRDALLKALDRLRQDPPLTRDEYVQICFGDQRLTYRVGCDLLRRIEERYGLKEVRESFYLDPDSFMRRYASLLGAGHGGINGKLTIGGYNSSTR